MYTLRPSTLTIGSGNFAAGAGNVRPLMLRALHEGWARQRGRLRFDGREVVHIEFLRPVRVDLLVDATTYDPVLWHAKGRKVTVHWQTYEWLPASAATFDLTKAHPRATVRALSTPRAIWRALHRPSAN